MQNKIMLITYPDSFGKNLKELYQAIHTHFARELGAIHILPFYPSSGDRGFAPIDYQQVAPEFGTWEDIDALAKDYEIMADFMINHLSKRSKEFRDFVEKHDASEYAHLFLRFRDFWENGYPTQEEIDLLNKRKPCAPCVDISFRDGTTEKIWCTFDDEQMDLDLRQDAAWDFVKRTLDNLVKHHIPLIRLDALAFATKKPGTTCFFLEPDFWELIGRVRDMLAGTGVELLPEIHDHYTRQLAIAQHGYYVYDFVLPVMVLHTLYTHSGTRLRHWLNICPRKQYTTLDTHDGLGTVDVVDLLSKEELEAVIRQTEKYGANFKWDYSKDSQGAKVVYQINCSYYSALGEDDQAYLLARAIQFFTPGIPQVYYMGLLAGPNDYELMERTHYDRNISRHNYTLEEIDENVKKPVVQKLCAMMRFYNAHPAFSGEMTLPEQREDELCILWQKDDDLVRLDADLNTNAFTISYQEKGEWKELSLEDAR